MSKIFQEYFACIPNMSLYSKLLSFKYTYMFYKNCDVWYDLNQVPGCLNFNHIYVFSWIEKWLRRWRNVYCGHAAQTSSSGGVSILTGICQTTVRDLRSAQCSGSAGSMRKSVLQSLQTDLECDAFNGASSNLIIQKSSCLLLLTTQLMIFVQAFIQW